ncbi:MAG: beta-lactamase family protein [Raineya sp.]|jgi:CubicO group peptidase (beta-lactamase class C family)|nr:beta-lactamase family protein [Raineya sp.]
MKYKCILTALLITQMVFGQDKIKSIDSLLNTLYSKKRINGNVLIAEEGKIIYNKSFGLAHEISKQKLDKNSIFDLASVTKQFTATGIVILKEQGKLKYDDPVSKYIPELSFYEGVTIKHLLQHTGGLPDYMNLFEASFDSNKEATNEDVIQYFAQKKPKILFKPSKNWRYSNTGYALLATIIERVSGLKYDIFLSKYIFTPLKMKSTFVQKSKIPTSKIKNLAQSYIYSDSLKELVPTDRLREFNYVKMFAGVVGDGGVHSTVMDLLKWNTAIRSNKIISEEGRKEMFSPAILADGSTFDYGYGWQLDSNKVFGKVVSHTGGWAGYLTLNEQHLDNNKTIIILFNHAGSEVVNKTVRYLLYELPLPNPTNKKEIKLTEDQLNKVIGVYEIQAGMEFFITIQGGEPYASMTNQAPLRIYAENETSFFFKEFDATILFKMNENGKVEKLTFSQGEQKMDAKKIK